jgi:hypothetical protein
MTQERTKLDEALIILSYKMGQDACRLRLIDDERNLERVASELYPDNKHERDAYIAGYKSAQRREREKQAGVRSTAIMRNIGSFGRSRDAVWIMTDSSAQEAKLAHLALADSSMS